MSRKESRQMRKHSSKVRSVFGQKKNKYVQVNLCQKLLFLHQLTHNMTTDCSLNYKFNTWKFQAQTWGEHVVYRNCFWHSEQFLYTTCSPHVLQKEELLTKIYLYWCNYELTNFSYRTRAIITRGLYYFYPIFLFHWGLYYRPFMY